MILEDFKKYHIDNFPPREVIATGAHLKDVKKETMIAIQKYRIYVRRQVILLYNGITTGNHKAPEHPDGTAIDSYLLPKDGPIDIHIIFKGALEAGFKGIGVYWNGKIYSTHFDLRPVYAFWTGIKNKQIKTWQFHSLLQDPRRIKLA